VSVPPLFDTTPCLELQWPTPFALLKKLQLSSEDEKQRDGSGDLKANQCDPRADLELY
jgi:hypothetical protein